MKKQNNETMTDGTAPKPEYMRDTVGLQTGGDVWVAEAVLRVRR